MIPLEPDKFYHIYNRANGNDSIFVVPDNYHFFLKKYKEHLHPIVDTYAYCLMPNHFHFLICIKSQEEIEALKSRNEQSFENFLSKQFSNFFSSYTQAFNKQQNRKGSLLIKNFKRKPVEDEKYLYKLIHYIHYNPVEARLGRSPSSWYFSSYNTILSEKPTKLKRKEVINLFDNIANFIFIHSQPPSISGIEDWLG